MFYNQLAEGSEEVNFPKRSDGKNQSVSIICGPGGSKSRLAKTAGAEAIWADKS